MHTPSSDSRAWVYYDYEIHRYRHPRAVLGLIELILGAD